MKAQLVHQVEDLPQQDPPRKDWEQREQVLLVLKPHNRHLRDQRQLHHPQKAQGLLCLLWQAQQQLGHHLKMKGQHVHQLEDLPQLDLPRKNREQQEVILILKPLERYLKDQRQQHHPQKVQGQRDQLVESQEEEII
ncbi:hypothetical protein NP173_23790 [Salmonella enterica]|nr:hypothetical protein [Salmonella enterica]